jgi:hypothetical protein
MKHYTDIDPTVDFVFPVNKIDREKGEKTNLIRRHLIFADFFLLRIENLGTEKKLFVLQEATTEAMLQ